MNYDKIYALAVPFPETDPVHSVLNGKLFRMLKDPETHHIHFFDAFNVESQLLESTGFLVRQDFPNGYSIVITESETVYQLKRLSAMIPGAPIVTEEYIQRMISDAWIVDEMQQADELAAKIKAVKVIGDYNNDPNGSVHFEFDQPIRENVFRSWLSLNEYPNYDEPIDWAKKELKVWGNEKCWSYRIVPTLDQQ